VAFSKDAASVATLGESLEKQAVTSNLTHDDPGIQHELPIEGFWRVMKDAIGAGRCWRDLPTLYQRTRHVLIAHQERPIYEFHW